MPTARGDGMEGKGCGGGGMEALCGSVGCAFGVGSLGGWDGGVYTSYKPIAMLREPWHVAIPRRHMPGLSMPHSIQRSMGTHTPVLVKASPSSVRRTTRS